jgi:pyruvate/2-oxoglutarate dehydrogenase complex dihydrolipoamide acyltransferase (E2) component
VTDVRVPKLGMSTVEVEIVRVLVEPGQVVKASDIVVEIESEKANYEIEAGAEGTVAEVLVSEGEEAKVGDVVVRIEP